VLQCQNSTCQVKLVQGGKDVLIPSQYVHNATSMNPGGRHGTRARLRAKEYRWVGGSCTEALTGKVALDLNREFSLVRFSIITHA